MPWAVWLAVVFAISPAAIARAQAPPCPLAAGDTRAIARVIDGETLALDDGRELRLIGALAPRGGDAGAAAGSWPPENATRAALASLVEGRSARLWHDARRSDRYGRILAQVMIDSTWLQGTLVERGLARAYGRPGVDACAEALVRLERHAREKGLGLWSNAAYSVRAASRSDWQRARASFQIVSATVRRVSRGSGDVYVTLGSRGRGYPLAAVVPANRSDLTGGTAPRRLIGRRILVRGWIEQRRGPVIVVDSKGQVELIEE
ncbi:MAG TPA: thermonuclease family protein [Hyphomicrobiaceae bacterium]|jgi:endonuclease YncB( thermonuclease family)|nr:thermonuclease family protein [Hyphomicrobiaceae bacterium]